MWKVAIHEREGIGKQGRERIVVEKEKSDVLESGRKTEWRKQKKMEGVGKKVDTPI